MSLIPDRELMKQEKINLAPMVDFLFLVVAALTSLLLVRIAVYDMNIHLAQAKPSEKDKQLFFSEAPFIVLSVDSYGIYRWISEQEEQMMQRDEIEKRLEQQSALFKEMSPLKVLVYIDRSAQWQAVADLLLAIQRAGLIAHPLYQKT
jgi:biopolymer transport protein ExbD